MYVYIVMQVDDVISTMWKCTLRATL